jgi:hypothetical protein
VAVALTTGVDEVLKVEVLENSVGEEVKEVEEVDV